MMKTKMKKRIKAMKEKEKDQILLMLYEHNPKLFSFYFGDESDREKTVNEYTGKIEGILNPSPRSLATEGLDDAAAQRLIESFEEIAFTGDRDLDDYYKARIYFCFAFNAVIFLADYGGPDEIYEEADDYFAKVCDYIMNGGSRVEDFMEMFASDIEEMLHHGDQCGLGDELRYLWAETGME